MAAQGDQLVIAAVEAVSVADHLDVWDVGAAGLDEASFALVIAAADCTVEADLAAAAQTVEVSCEAIVEGFLKVSGYLGEINGIGLPTGV